MQGTTPREVKREDIGWLAGIIDGEGSILFHRSKRADFNKILYGLYIVGGDLKLLGKASRIINDVLGEDRAKWIEKKYRKSTIKTNKKMYCLQIWRQSDLKKLFEIILPHLTEKYFSAARLLNFLLNHKKGHWFKEGEIESYFKFTPVETK